MEKDVTSAITYVGEVAKGRIIAPPRLAQDFPKISRTTCVLMVRLSKKIGNGRKLETKQKSFASSRIALGSFHEPCNSEHS